MPFFFVKSSYAPALTALDNFPWVSVAVTFAGNAIDSDRIDPAIKLSQGAGSVCNTLPA